MSAPSTFLASSVSALNPAWDKITMISLFFLSSCIYFFIVSSVDRNFSPFTFLGWVVTGVSSVTTPITATVIPSIFFTIYGFNSFNPTTFAPRIGKFASPIRSLRTAWPKSNSWFPTTMASKPMTFIASMEDLPWKRFAQLFPWIISPAARNSVGFSARRFSARDARYASPPWASSEPYGL